MSALADPADTTHRHVFETSDGGQIRYVAAHKRIYAIKQGPGGRHNVSTPMTPDRARLMASRLNELAAIADAEAEGGR